MTAKNFKWPGIVLMISLICLIYLFISSGNFYTLAPNEVYDDGLQYSAAQNIVAGKWLGDYSSLTLAKGASYPLWTALLHVLDIPLWLGNSLLTIVAALAVILVVRLMTTNKWVLVGLFAALVFNPMVSLRAYRDSIAPAVLLMLMAWSISILVYKIRSTQSSKQKNQKSIDRKPQSTYIALTVIASFALPLWWNLREDYFWLLPFIVASIVVFLIHLGQALRKDRRHFDYRVLLLPALVIVVPFISLGVANAAISKVNQEKYGQFTLNDYLYGSFPNAYGALTRIKDDAKPVVVPISLKMRKEAYAVSPSFQRLQPCLDSTTGVAGACEFFRYNPRAWGDYEGGWFFWAMRLAVDKQGIKSASEADRLYANIANEINDACDKKEIECIDAHRSGFATPVNKSTAKAIARRAVTVAGFALSQQRNDQVEKSWWPAPGAVKQNPSSEKMSDFLGVRYDSDEVNGGVQAKYSLRQIIWSVYRVAMKPLFILALLVLIFGSILAWRRSELRMLLLVTWGVGMLIALRIVMLAYVDVTAFPAVNTLYLSTVYPLFSIFIALSALIAQRSWVSLRRSKTIL